MDWSILETAIEYAFYTFIGGVAAILLVALFYQKIYIEDNDNWKAGTTLAIIFIFLTAMYYLLIYKGVL